MPSTITNATKQALFLNFKRKYPTKTAAEIETIVNNQLKFWAHIERQTRSDAKDMQGYGK